MKSIIAILVSVLACLGAVDGAQRPDISEVSIGTNFPPKVIAFCADKEQQTQRLAQRLKGEIPQVITEYFDAARKGDWARAFDLFREVQDLFGQPSPSQNQKTIDATARAAVLEVQMTLEQFVEGEPKYALTFGTDIARSIPRGSIYFGGTDPGRGLVTAFCASHEKADPFFTLTQNALADGSYLEYLRTMYGEKIYVPTQDDSQRAFQEYLDDAQRRLAHDRDFPKEPRQLRPGENVKLVRNKVNVSGQVAVMSVNGLLAKIIFERNPAREFYLEESFPLDWMYPHLSPHELILKINRHPLTTLPGETVNRDRKFWLEQQQALIGNRLKPESSVDEVCRLVEKVFWDHDLSGFTGDPKFVQSDHACKTYSKLRSSIGGVYAWRATHAKEPEQRERMSREADFAFRQAFALCPTSPEAVFRYVNLLVEGKRFEDASRIAETAAKLHPGNAQFDNLLEEIQRKMKKD